MGNIRFSGQNRDIPSHVLTSPRENVFETNNIRFHINGKYLSDFSDKGIERFIEKNYNNKSGFLGGLGLGWGGKDLEFAEVKAFIQAAAANSDKLQGMTFDLADTQLGLFDDDDVKVDDIRHSFSLEYKPAQGASNAGSSSPSVSFVDATSARYDHREAKRAETRAEGAFKTEQTTHRDLQKGVQQATRERDRIAGRIGDNAVQELAEADNRLQQLGTRKNELQAEMRETRLALSQQGIAEPRQRELRLALRGMELEFKEVEDDAKKLKSDMGKRHGFWSFLGGGSTLEDLRKANAALEKAQQALDAHKPKLDEARALWQRSKENREAVERGESLDEQEAASPAEPAAPAAPADRPTPPTPPPAAADAPAADTPAAPETPVAPTPAPAAAPPATPSAAGLPPGEQHLQTLLALPPAQQLAALNQIPEADRAAVLAMANDYLAAGRPDNPMGLSDTDHQALAGVQQPVAKLRLNALLTWGEGAQNAYLQQADQRTRDEIQQHLNQQLFDQQLAAQVEAFRSRLQAAAPADNQTGAGDETPVTPSAPATAPEVTMVPTQQPTPPVTTQASPASPLSLSAWQALPVADKLTRFGDLPAADQDLTFSGLDLASKGEVLLGLAAQRMEDEPTRQRLSQLMRPDEKQALVNQLDEVQRATAGQPYPRKTEISALLGMFAQQGVRPVAQPPVTAAPAPQPVQPQPPAQPSAPAHPVVQEEAAPTPRPVQQPAQPRPERPPVVEQQPAPVQQPAAQPAAEAPAQPPSGIPAQPTEAQYNAMAEELLQLDPISRMQNFDAIELKDKQALLNRMPAQVQVELLLTQIYPDDQTANRQALIQGLSPAAKQAIGQKCEEGLPGATAADAALGAAMTKLMGELGHRPGAAPAAAAPQPTVQQQPAQGPAPQGPRDQPAPVQGPAQPSGRLDMTAQLGQLKKELANKTMFGMGGVANPQVINELVEQIWTMGTPANQVAMSKALVEGGQSKVLAGVLANVQVTDEEITRVLTAPSFPAAKFMNDIDDGKAFLMLRNLGQAAARKDAMGQRATQVMISVVEAYSSGLDREKPFERLRDANDGVWTHVPKAVKDKVDAMFNSWWN